MKYLRHSTGRAAFCIFLASAFVLAGTSPAWAQWVNLAQADTGKTAKASKAADEDNDQKLRISWLDKQTNRRDVYVLTIGKPATLGGLVVTASKCLPDYGAVLGQDVAWLDVTEGPEGSGRTAPWFSGWTFNTYPEIATMDHPRYDMQLLGCGEKERKIVNRGRTAPVLTPEAPAKDTESPDDAPVDEKNDPFYVPGVEKKPETQNQTQAPATETAAQAMPVQEQAAVPAAEPAAESEAPAGEQAAPVVGPAEATPPANGNGANKGEMDQLHQLMDGGVY